MDQKKYFEISTFDKLIKIINAQKDYIKESVELYETPEESDDLFMHAFGKILDFLIKAMGYHNI